MYFFTSDIMSNKYVTEALEENRHSNPYRRFKNVYSPPLWFSWLRLRLSCVWSWVRFPTDVGVCFNTTAKWGPIHSKTVLNSLQQFFMLNLNYEINSYQLKFEKHGKAPKSIGCRENFNYGPTNMPGNQWRNHFNWEGDHLLVLYIPCLFSHFFPYPGSVTASSYNYYHLHFLARKSLQIHSYFIS